MTRRGGQRARALLPVLLLTCALAGAEPAAVGVGTRTVIAGGEAGPPPIAVRLEPVRDDLTLPVALATVGGGTDLMLVTQLEGVVSLLEGEVPRPGPVLDLRHRVTSLEGEQGLFSVALEPASVAERRGRDRQLVAAFTELGSGDLVVAAYPWDDRFLFADERRERVLLRIPMPEPYHHGGAVAFGPDGMLWVGVGDGEVGIAARLGPTWTAQALDELRGSLLRIEPLPAGADEAYAVPDDNPLRTLGSGRFGERVRPEIWAFGFRNPWKLHFGPDGTLFVADVGEDTWEEINVAVPGGNHGWPAREGPACVLRHDLAEPLDPACLRLEAFEDPVVAYRHQDVDPLGGSAVVGGVVVRDQRLGPLLGHYLFGDFVSGRIWAYDPEGHAVVALLDTDLALTGFAVGLDDEVLVIGIGGELARLVRDDDGAP